MSQAITVNVKTHYLEDESKPADSRFVYAYEIHIENLSDESAQLISRHWKITDSNEEVQEVEGLGVVGQQPTLKPGESYRYTSGVVLETESGMMEGSYLMRNESGGEFEAAIPAFALVSPQALH
ncbi:Co2+/Mg2+ efflux protein ApaG [Agaribacterium haliotis]|uniref:Co2+/Mg2+ efflux protein ApaG n=1 Tax=Agaribacterium haliotis TaxID=2013869 RepID=UPI000BB58A90|nr:Co2+/Mg2+ efflux protein ApaG [Agaribacterium haliotis]